MQRTPKPGQRVPQPLRIYPEPGTIKVSSPDSLPRATALGTPLNKDNNRLTEALRATTAPREKLRETAQAATPAQRQDKAFSEALDKQYEAIANAQSGPRWPHRSQECARRGAGQNPGRQAAHRGALAFPTPLLLNKEGLPQATGLLCYLREWAIYSFTKRW